MVLRLTTSHYFYNSLWIHLITVCTYHLHACTRYSSKHHENSATHFQQVCAGFQRVHGTEFSPIDASLESKTFFFSENILSTQKLFSFSWLFMWSYQPFVFKILPCSHPYPFVQFADKFICPFECYRTDYNCCKCLCIKCISLCFLLSNSLFQNAIVQTKLSITFWSHEMGRHGGVDAGCICCSANDRRQILPALCYRYPNHKRKFGRRG